MFVKIVSTTFNQLDNSNPRKNQVSEKIGRLGHTAFNGLSYSQPRVKLIGVITILCFLGLLEWKKGLLTSTMRFTAHKIKKFRSELANSLNKRYGWFDARSASNGGQNPSSKTQQQTDNNQASQAMSYTVYHKDGKAGTYVKPSASSKRQAP